MMENEEEKIKVLDHGYVKFVESWGSDQRIIESARMSTDGAFRGWGPRCGKCGYGDSEMVVDSGCPMCSGTTVSGDERLLKYLYDNKHSTPFEFCGLTIEVQAPILVFREWHRHRTQSYNEMSARYTPLPDLYYVPTLERVMLNANGSNKQAGRAMGADELSEDNAKEWLKYLVDEYDDVERFYRYGLKIGIPKELARAIMPVGHYSRMRATANLRNWLAFLTLRMDSKAQWEIRQYANAVGQLIETCFPRTWKLFIDK